MPACEAQDLLLIPALFCSSFRCYPIKVFWGNIVCVQVGGANPRLTSLARSSPSYILLVSHLSRAPHHPTYQRAYRLPSRPRRPGKYSLATLPKRLQTVPTRLQLFKRWIHFINDCALNISIGFDNTYAMGSHLFFG